MQIECRPMRALVQNTDRDLGGKILKQLELCHRATRYAL
jgi:hypothetical protein